jgi:hypothetical protein
MMVLKQFTGFLVENGVGCFTASACYSIGDGFVDRCLELETSFTDSRCNRVINILGWFENGFGWWFNDLPLNDGLLG